MGGDPGSTSAATCTRRHYERLLLPFERHLNGDQDKRKRRKTTSSGAKRGKKPTHRTTDSSNTIKYKRKVGKQVVNGVRGKNKCEHESYSDSTPEKKQQLDDEPKQPKLIVKLNLLKVKSQQESQIQTTDNELTDDCAKDEQSKVKPQVNDSSSDTEDTDSDKKELKREELTEEEDQIVDEEEEEEREVETALKNSANNETAVMHLSPVSDISNDEEVSVCDNKIESSTASSMTVTQTQTPTLTQTQTQNLTQQLLSDPKNSISNVSSLKHPIACTTSSAPLPFPVAASPLFSISTLVNSVKAETITPSPPPMSATAPLAPPPLPQTSSLPTKSVASKSMPMSSSLQIKRTSYDIYQRRPSVIHKTSNPMYTVAEHQSKHPNISKNKNISSVPLPAHSSFKNECEPKKMPSDFAYNDVLDLSVKKRYLEADSRTSPSQVSIDGSFGLDLSLKKKKIESPKLQVPKPKLETISPTLLPTSMSTSMPTSMSTSLPTSLPPTPQKSCPPQPTVNIVPQSVQKSVHYHQALPHIESHAKHQSKQHKLHQQQLSHHHHHQREQQVEKHHSSQQQIVKPQVRHPPQVSMVSQSSHQIHHNNHNNHNNHRQQHHQQQSHHNSAHVLQQQQQRQQHSPKIDSELLASKMLHQSIMPMSSHLSPVRPAISEYNPSLPTFYTPPNIWWQSTPSLHPNSVPTSASFMSPSIASVSPHLMGSHSLIPSASYPNDHLLSQFDSVKAANYAAYKQLLDQQQQQQQHPYNFFMNNFYATK